MIELFPAVCMADFTVLIEPCPAVCPDFPQLSRLSQEELEELLEDEDRLEELVESLPQVKPLLDELQASMERVEKLAGEFAAIQERVRHRLRAVASS